MTVPGGELYKVWTSLRVIIAGNGTSLGFHKTTMNLWEDAKRALYLPTGEMESICYVYKTDHRDIQELSRADD